MKDTRVMLRAVHRDQEYPSVATLVQIGKSSSERALVALGEEDDPLRRRLLLDVMKGVEGPVVTLLMLELELFEARDAKRHNVAKKIERSLMTLLPEWGVEGYSYPALDPDHFPGYEDFYPPKFRPF